MNKRVLFVVGPTGSGKSRFAVALAKKLRGEILSADSMQIYRGMDIGTDKPSAWMRRRVRHHLLDIVTPGEEFSVYEFRKKVLPLLDEINRRKRVPIVVGGTGLYIKAIIDGISPQPGKNDEIREALRREARLRGAQVLHTRLSEADPVVARRVHPHDEKRIVRALEVLEVSGKRLSDWEEETPSLGELGYRFWMVGIKKSREEIYGQINRRVDQMLRKGFLKEAKRLFTKPLSLTARQAIGYRELFDHLDGRLSLEEARKLIKQHTRNLVKRQSTWFKKERRICWISDTDQRALEDVIRWVREKAPS